MLNQKVYIKPEYVDFVNPIVGEMDKINYQPWDVIKVYEESQLTGSINDDSRKFIVYDLQQNKFFLKAIREDYLITIEDRREEKLQQLFDKNI
jgi:hypothetical protein